MIIKSETNRKCRVSLSVYPTYLVRQPKGRGVEYHILVVAIGLALMSRGGGEWSIDYGIAKELR